MVKEDSIHFRLSYYVSPFPSIPLVYHLRRLDGWKIIIS
jgi:hypothetical protein